MEKHIREILEIDDSSPAVTGSQMGAIIYNLALERDSALRMVSMLWGDQLSSQEILDAVRKAIGDEEERELQEQASTV